MPQLPQPSRPRESQVAGEQPSFSSIIRDQWRSVAPQVGLLALLYGGLVALAVLTTKMLELGWKEYSLGLGLLVLIAVLAVVGSSILAKAPLESRLKAATDRVQEAAARLELEAATTGQLITFLRGEKTWLIDDTEVYEIEAEADEAVDVIAPDLYYEEQDDYQKIIADNIAKPEGATYRYLVPNLGENRSQASRVREGLKRRLQALKVSDPERVIGERFMVAFLNERDQFPSASLHGLAIYRWRDGRRQCLQYLPREFGALNINIPLRDTWDGEVKLGTKVVDAAADEFEHLFEKADPQRRPIDQQE
jgi:type II secretory pathway pseudopilin PulG